jgi:hypothetical protein
MDSESQVRLYVNTKLGRWGAWAFPQEARTAMSAREIAVQETPEQAHERFASWNSEPSDDWVYFCTAHHHCSASAFQSGTDEEDEKNQDGLHLTVGRIGDDRHDLHARFYLDGNCFDPDLSRFWPIDPELAERVPPSVHDTLARFQMCEKVILDFPEAWRRNVIERQQPLRKFESAGCHLDWELSPAPVWVRAEQALQEIAGQSELTGGIEEEELLAILESLHGNSLQAAIVQTCFRYGVTPEELLAQFNAYELP